MESWLSKTINTIIPKHETSVWTPANLRPSLDQKVGCFTSYLDTLGSRLLCPSGMEYHSYRIRIDRDSGFSPGIVACRFETVGERSILSLTRDVSNMLAVGYHLRTRYNTVKTSCAVLKASCGIMPSEIRQLEPIEEQSKAWREAGCGLYEPAKRSEMQLPLPIFFFVFFGADAFFGHCCFKMRV